MKIPYRIRINNNVFQACSFVNVSPLAKRHTYIKMDALIVFFRTQSLLVFTFLLQSLQWRVPILPVYL